MCIRFLKYKLKIKFCVEIYMYIEYNFNIRKRSVNFVNFGVDKVIKLKKWKLIIVNEVI